MNKDHFKSDSLLVITALIWGFAFVAQRIGMDYVGPFTFTGIRFALGSLVLVPFMMRAQKSKPNDRSQAPSFKNLLAGSTLAGIILFGGAALQQVGMVYTTAGKAGFITGLYVIIVPLIAILYNKKSQAGTWVGAILATIGLYLLSVTATFEMEWGDLLVLCGAFLWALHVTVIGWLAPKHNASHLAFLQFIICALLSLLIAGIFETVTWQGLKGAAGTILYGGLLSVGVGYFLQVVAQKNAHPAHAAIIMSLEAVFAALGGWMILDERFTTRGLAGCALMLTGMIFSAMWSQIRNPERGDSNPIQNKRAEEMWREYLKSTGREQNEKEWKYTVWHFCDDEKNANELAELCRKGVKRGTASLYFWYKEKGERQPQIGDYSIITDWKGTPRCLIRTKKITIVPFHDVTEEMARIEGEGDGTLSYWKDAHKKYFTMELMKEGKVFSDEMKVLFEEVELVYPALV